MSSLLVSLRGGDAVPAFAAATHQARRMFSHNSNSSRRSSSGKEESESAVVFDEFGAFEQAHGEEELFHVIERQHEENESEDEDAEDDEQTEEQLRRLSEKMRRAAIPSQKNSPGMREAAVSAFKQAAQRKKEEPSQKASPKAVPAAGSSKAADADAELEHGHIRAATDPLSSAALSRMRYYRKLIPAPKTQNPSPKSQPHAVNPISSAAKSTDENRRFFPPSQSAAAVLYHSNRSLPITIPSKKGSPTNDDSHRFRADIHPRIAADSSFILPAASFLPTALQKSFVPQSGEDDEVDRRSPSALDKHRDSLKEMNRGHSGFEKDEQFGFEFEMDM